MFTQLALKSLLDRKGSVLLALMAMTVSIFVLLGVEHIRYQAKASFSNTVSGVDLIVGARTGSLNLLLYSVFRIGTPSNNVSWQSFQTIAANPNVKWAIPISLGDSHKGYRVLGTNHHYFQHFSYGQQQRLHFDQGHAFDHVLDVVLGAEVAKKLNYQLGDKLTLAHGIANTNFSRHDDYPFTVVGILAPTGTPVDQTLHISLQGIEAIHLDWQHGIKLSQETINPDTLDALPLTPNSITALMLGLESKMTTFQVQRTINQYTQEPLLAVLPGVALSELWQMMGLLEKTLLLVSTLVFIAACLGVSAMLLLSIRERQYEIQLLRIIGAPPYFLLLLIEIEALLITCSSIVLAIGLLTLCLLGFQDAIVSHFGLHITTNILNQQNLYLMAAIIGASIVVTLIPSLSGYWRAKIKVVH